MFHDNCIILCHKASPSAYSFVYVDIERGDLIDQHNPPLPSDLDLFIMEVSQSFAADKWDEEQLLKGYDPECQIIEQKPDS